MYGTLPLCSSQCDWHVSVRKGVGIMPFHSCCPDLGAYHDVFQLLSHIVIVKLHASTALNVGCQLLLQAGSLQVFPRCMLDV